MNKAVSEERHREGAALLGNNLSQYTSTKQFQPRQKIKEEKKKTQSYQHNHIGKEFLKCTKITT
jgi:hypothetical protein